MAKSRNVEGWACVPTTIRTVYPETGDNHVLYVETYHKIKRPDGYRCESNSTYNVYFVSKDDNGWSAQKIVSEPGTGKPIVECWYAVADQPTLTQLCLRLTIREKVWP